MPLKLVRRVGRPCWYLRGTVRGEPVFETTGIPLEDRQRADALRIRREAQILDEAIHGTRASRTFEQAAVEYLEAVQPAATQRIAIAGHENKDGSLRPCLVTDFGRTLLSAIDQEMVDRVIRRRYPAGPPATIQRNLLTPLVAVLRYGAKRKWCDEPKLQRPKVRRARRAAMSVEQFAAVYATAAKHLKPLLVFMAYTGARPSEATELEWSDVDLAARWAIIDRTKSDEPRGVPLNREVIVELANLKHREGPVFLTNRRAPYRDTDRKEGGQFKTGFRLACERAGVAGFTPHMLRHTCSTWLVMMGVHPYDKDDILGHRATDMSRLYTHLPQAHLIAAVDRLPALIRAISEPEPKRNARKRRRNKTVAV